MKIKQMWTGLKKVQSFLFMGNLEEDEAIVDGFERDYTIMINAPGGRIWFKLDTRADVTVIGSDRMRYFGKD